MPLAAQKRRLLRGLQRRLKNDKQFVLDELAPVYHTYIESDTGTITYSAHTVESEPVIVPKDWREPSVTATPSEEWFLVLDCLFEQNELTFPAFVQLTRKTITVCLHGTEPAVDAVYDFIRDETLVENEAYSGGTGAELATTVAEQPTWRDVFSDRQAAQRETYIN